MKQLKDNEMCVQAVLTRTDGKSTGMRCIWVNADKAIVGNTVKVEEDDGTWSEGWVVDAVYGTPLAKDVVVHQSHAHTRQRKASDI